MATMFGIVNLSTYIIGSVLIILLPGPNSLYVMSTASRFGVRAGYNAALAVVLGDSILMLLTVIGAASLLQSFSVLFLLLKIIGALYLAWLGLQLFRAALVAWKHRQAKKIIEKSNNKSSESFFRKALGISLLNPKAILFFLSFFIQFVDVNYPHPALSFFILGFIIQIISFSYLSALIFAGSKMAKFFQHHYALSVVGIAAVGCLFFAFAAKLLFSTL